MRCGALLIAPALLRGDELAFKLSGDAAPLNPSADLQGFKYAVLLHRNDAKRDYADHYARFRHYDLDFLEFEIFDVMVNSKFCAIRANPRLSEILEKSVRIFERKVAQSEELRTQLTRCLGPRICQLVLGARAYYNYSLNECFLGSAHKLFGSRARSPQPALCTPLFL